MAYVLEFSMLSVFMRMAESWTSSWLTSNEMINCQDNGVKEPTLAYFFNWGDKKHAYSFFCLGSWEAEKHSTEHGGVSAAMEIRLKWSKFEEKLQHHSNPERQEWGHYGLVMEHLASIHEALIPSTEGGAGLGREGQDILSRIPF